MTLTTVLRRLLSLMVVGVLSFGLVGCGGPTGGNDNDNGGNGNENTNDNGGDDGGDNGGDSTPLSISTNTKTASISIDGSNVAIDAGSLVLPRSSSAGGGDAARVITGPGDGEDDGEEGEEEEEVDDEEEELDDEEEELDDEEEELDDEEEELDDEEEELDDEEEELDDEEEELDDEEEELDDEEDDIDDEDGEEDEEDLDEEDLDDLDDEDLDDLEDELDDLEEDLDEDLDDLDDEELDELEDELDEIEDEIEDIIDEDEEFDEADFEFDEDDPFDDFDEEELDANFADFIDEAAVLFVDVELSAEDLDELIEEGEIDFDDFDELFGDDSDEAILELLEEFYEGEEEHELVSLALGLGDDDFTEEFDLEEIDLEELEDIFDEDFEISEELEAILLEEIDFGELALIEIEFDPFDGEIPEGLEDLFDDDGEFELEELLAIEDEDLAELAGELDAEILAALEAADDFEDLADLDGDDLIAALEALEDELVDLEFASSDEFAGQRLDSLGSFPLIETAMDGTMSVSSGAEELAGQAKIGPENAAAFDIDETMSTVTIEDLMDIDPDTIGDTLMLVYDAIIQHDDGSIEEVHVEIEIVAEEPVTRELQNETVEITTLLNLSLREAGSIIAADGTVTPFENTDVSVAVLQYTVRDVDGMVEAVGTLDFADDVDLQDMNSGLVAPAAN